MGRIRNFIWGRIMSITDWLTGCFWQAFANWIKKDPAAAKERIAAIMESRIELMVAAEESPDPPETTV